MTEPTSHQDGSPDPDDSPQWARLHLWQIAVLRDLALVMAFAGAVWLFLFLRAVTIPIALGFLLASIYNPVVTGATRRFGWPRWLTTAFGVGGLIALALLFLAVGVPRLVIALKDFGGALPGYASIVLGALGIDDQDLVEQVRSLDLPLQDAGPLLARATSVLGVAASLLGSLVYSLVAGLFTLATFAWMSVHFDRLPDIKRFLPASRREQVWSVLQRFERVFGGFVRGQVLVAIFTTSCFAFGFTLIGVPHAFVAAMIGGVFSFVPNGQASGWVLAVLFSALATTGAEPYPWLDVLLWPSCVYAVSQSLETFVVTPLVQGSYTRLHPLAVLGAVIGGAAVGGLTGILLAIPITACGWIVLRELVAPAVEQLASER